MGRTFRSLSEPQREDFDTDEEYESALDYYEGVLLDREQYYHDKI